MPALAMVREYRVYSFTATASANHVTVKSMIAVRVRSAKRSEESIPGAAPARGQRRESLLQLVEAVP
mgnify:FL=1